MLNKWQEWYKGADPKDFQDDNTTTYELAGKFLADCKVVEDWGCGYGGFKPFCQGQYIGVDGTKTPAVNKLVDLRKYRSLIEGILLRHVLEHNYDWEEVLDNAVASASKKLCLVLFTPFVDMTHEIKHNREAGVDVPDLAFNPGDLEQHFNKYQWTTETITTNKGYGVEHIYYITKETK